MHRSPSTKVYVGLTSQKPSHRWGKDGRNYRTQPFYRAICKYGWGNIEHIILAEVDSREKAREFEKHYITLFNSTNPEHGYNFCTGGEVNDARRGQLVGEETRRKLSRAKSGANNPNYGKSMGEEQREKLRKYHLGRKLGVETRAKISERQRGANNHEAKRVLQYTRDGQFVKEWSCVSDAAETLCGRRASSCNISSCCAGKIPSAYGFIWKYEEKEGTQS